MTRKTKGLEVINFCCFRRYGLCHCSVVGSPSVARRTNNRKVAGSKPAKVVCITVLTGNRRG